MSEAGFIFFKEWLPDLQDLDNPGMTEARNVLPVQGSYAPFLPLDTTAARGTLPAQANGGIFTRSEAGAVDVMYAGTSAQLYASTSGAAFTLLSSATYGATSLWSFARYDDIVVAVAAGVVPQQHTLLSASGFTALATSGTAPTARAAGVVGQFVVLGNLDSGETDVQWSGIDAPNSWPTPNSATAIAQQSGLQTLGKYGKVKAIVGGDQFGLIFQTDAVTRMTYEGGNSVFRFDVLAKRVGISSPYGVAEADSKYFFLGNQGVCVTDGVSVQYIGHGKVDEWLLSRAADLDNEVYAAVDPRRKLVYWTFRDTGLVSDTVLIYNYVENRFSYASMSSRGLFSLPYGDAYIGSFGCVHGFDTANVFRPLEGAAGTAVLTTAEIEAARGRHSFVPGVKPLVSGTTPAVTVALGTRNSQDPSALTYTSEVSATAATGFCDFRSEANYHRARVTITGTFQKTWAVEPKAVPAGKR